MYLSIHEYAAEKLAASGAAVATGGRAAARRLLRALRHRRQRCEALHRHGGVRAAPARWRSSSTTSSPPAGAPSRAGDRRLRSRRLRAAWEAVQTTGPFELAPSVSASRSMRWQAHPAVAARCRAGARRRGRRSPRGRLEHATTSARAAPSAWRRSANDRGAKPRCSPASATSSAQQGRMEEARRQRRDARSRLRAELGETDARPLLAELGIVQRQTGAMEEARRHLRARARRSTRQVGDGDAEAKVLNSLAIVHAEQGRFDDARTRLRARARAQPGARRSPRRPGSCSATSVR